MNKRDGMLGLIHDKASPEYIPAAFFLHFDNAYHQGQAAMDKHLEFFRTTGMDFVKIQYEQPFPSSTPIRKPEDWAHAPHCSEEFFETPIQVAEGLVKAAKSEALVIMTLYSPFMWAAHLAEDGIISKHLEEDPEAVKKGLEIMTENVLTLVRGCKRVGVDGFYASSQGGEAFRFQDLNIFQEYIKPTDLAVWDELSSCSFNILHICDYEGGYDDLTPFLDYPGHVVNSSLKVGDQTLTPKDASQLFGRPFMGGMERKGVLATGNSEAIQQAATEVLAQAPERFILAADCTVPSDTPWENLKTAIETAHQYRRH
ncbi:MAG TPA: uroporphyrinogen decarboxylase family protein [Anaerolineales bacterium]|nr:uroporphyrinogen decarboxylase family protein [Anaerolineales bacterium]